MSDPSAVIASSDSRVRAGQNRDAASLRPGPLAHPGHGPDAVQEHERPPAVGVYSQ